MSDTTDALDQAQHGVDAQDPLTAAEQRITELKAEIEQLRAELDIYISSDQMRELTAERKLAEARAWLGSYGAGDAKLGDLAAILKGEQ